MDPTRINEARKAGYSDGEILEFLSSQGMGDKIGQARQVGYGDKEILDHLATPPRSGGESAARVLGVAAQGVNDGVVNTLSAPADLSGDVMKHLGLVSPDTPSISSVYRQAVDDVASLPLRVRDAVKQGSFTPIFAPRDAYQTRITPENETERVANSAGEAVGTVAGMVVPAGAMAGPAKAAVPGMRAPVEGTGTAAARAVASQPGMQVAANVAGNVAGELTDNPWVGLGTALAVPVAAHGARRAVSAAPATTGAEAERRSLLIDAEKEGIPVSFSKAVDSKGGQFVESVLSKLPFVGNRQNALTESGKTAFNKAVFDKVPLLKGEGIDAATPGAMQAAFKKVSDRFNALAESTTLRVDSGFGVALDKVEGEYGKQLLSQVNKGAMDKLQELQAAAKTINKPGVAAVEIDGRTYQNIRSKLSAQAAETTDGQLRRALGGMIEALDDVASRSIPKDMAKDWADVRRSWRVLSMIDDAVRNRHGGESAVGNIAPGALDVRAGKDPEMRRLAQVGMKFVGDKTPDSGTAMRQLALNAGGLGGAGTAGAMGVIDPLTTGALMGGGVLTDMLLNNPMMRKALAARYGNPSDPVLTKGLVATLAGERAVQGGR